MAPNRVPTVHAGSALEQKSERLGDDPVNALESVELTQQVMLKT